MAASLIYFPTEGPHRIQFPTPENLTPLNGQIPSYGVTFTKEVVPVVAVGNQGADADGFFPINAAYLAAAGCKPQRVGEDATIFIDDGLRCCSIFLNEATILPAPGDKPADQVVMFKVRCAMNNVGTTVATFSIGLKVSTSDTNRQRTDFNGLLCTVSGVLCNQFEIWAAVQVPDAPAVAQPVEVRLAMIADRIGSQGFKYLPPTTTGGAELPQLK